MTSVKDLIQQLTDASRGNPNMEVRLIVSVEVSIDDVQKNFPIHYDCFNVSSSHPKFLYLTAS